ncbi:MULTISPECIES: TetR/AcrR family transcriptional regulator [unclassified Luteococcus]|uniref:TetR/AcrR family transcriptional regulator n=1 Tax=unclassified Luteococcus TaxID=2639923 RepID=UPI00313CAD5A
MSNIPENQSDVTLPVTPVPAPVPASPESASSPASARRRRGRRPAGADTRATILASARKLFATRGYDAVSLRSIARDADVDPALVHHYFEGKPAVFAASLMTAESNPTHRLALISQAPWDEVGHTIVKVFVELWDNPAQKSAARGIIQTAMTPDEGVRPFREFLVSEILAKLPTPDHEGRLDPRRGQLMVSQLMGLAMARYVLQLSEVVAATPDQLADWVGPTLQRYLDEPLEPAQG